MGYWMQAAARSPLPASKAVLVPPRLPRHEPGRKETTMADTTVRRRGPGAMQDVDRHVARRIRERRLELGLTQQQLAELVGVTSQQAHKYEKGDNRVAV